MKLVKKMIMTGVLVVAFSGLTGCIKPYNTPEFIEIQANQTAFLIPLVGDTSDQAVFESESLLAETKVATKEVQIPKRWVQMGREDWDGQWKNSAKLILVDRTPQTREWTSDANSGTFATNQGVTAKTKDGIKLTLNVNSTAQIDENMATKYLYVYNTNPLSQVMDTEVKTMVHSNLIEQVSKYTLEELDVEKIMVDLRKDVQGYFKDRGITVTALGFSSDPIYPTDIQNSMNEKIKAQNNQEAQAIANKTAEDKAKSQALQAQLQQDILTSQIKLKELENETKMIEKWDGKLPTVQGGGDGQILDISNLTK